LLKAFDKQILAQGQCKLSRSHTLIVVCFCFFLKTINNGIVKEKNKHTAKNQLNCINKTTLGSLSPVWLLHFAKF